MREIKFRAWNSKELKQVDQITIGENGWSCEGGYGVSIPYQPHIILMQYTGLKDKNGKDIYEGDILRYHYFEDYSIGVCDYVECDRYEIGVVEWDKVGYHLVGEKGYSPSLGNICIDSFEIIGNIYENPELL